MSLKLFVLRGLEEVDRWLYRSEKCRCGPGPPPNRQSVHSAAPSISNNINGVIVGSAALVEFSQVTTGALRCAREMDVSPCVWNWCDLK